MNKEVTQIVNDPIYSLLSQKARVDEDTSYRTSSVQCATTNGTGTLLDPLNSSAGKTTQIFISDNSGSKLRLGTIALRLHMVIHQSGTTTAACPMTGNYFQNAPCWAMVGLLINKVTLSINDGQGEQIYYSSTDNHFMEEFIARCLSQYSWQELSEMGETLFTPMDDKTYTVATTIAAAANPTDSALLQRATDYCGNFTTVNTTYSSHKKEVVKTVPLSLLCCLPRDGIMKNARVLKLDISWTTTTDILDHLSGTGTTTDDGAVSLLQCNVLCDYYNMNPARSVIMAKEKNEGEMDILPFLYTTIHPETYAVDTDINIRNIKNFHSVMIFQIANGFNNARLTTNLRTYKSHSQFIFGGNSAGANEKIRLIADSPAGEPESTVTGWSSVQINYNGLDYPNTAITTSRTNNSTLCPDFQQLYYEVLKASGRYGNRSQCAAISYDEFRRVYPYIWLKPSADNAPKMPEEPHDLTIRLRGGVAGAIAVVIFHYGIMTIGKGGSIQKY